MSKICSIVRIPLELNSSHLDNLREWPKKSIEA